jgi:hypothetical protein
MHLPEDALPGKCIVCFSRGKMRRYAGRITWLCASICPACHSRRAEPLSFILLLISMNGGPDACADIAAGVVIYSAPRYVGWDDICVLYREQIGDMLSLIEAEFGSDYAAVMRTGRPRRTH